VNIINVIDVILIADSVNILNVVLNILIGFAIVLKILGLSGKVFGTLGLFWRRSEEMSGGIVGVSKDFFVLVHNFSVIFTFGGLILGASALFLGILSSPKKNVRINKDNLLETLRIGGSRGREVPPYLAWARLELRWAFWRTGRGMSEARRAKSRAATDGFR
jgi:hypothetical protein